MQVTKVDEGFNLDLGDGNVSFLPNDKVIENKERLEVFLTHKKDVQEFLLTMMILYNAFYTQSMEIKKRTDIDSAEYNVEVMNNYKVLQLMNTLKTKFFDTQDNESIEYAKNFFNYLDSENTTDKDVTV